MKRQWKILLLVVLVSLIGLAVFRYWPFPGPIMTKTVFVKAAGVSVSGDVSTTASVAIKPAASLPPDASRVTDTIGTPVEIDISDGKMGGNTVITFPYPSTVPANEQDLMMVKAYSQQAKTWLIVPAHNDKKKRQLTVSFSDTASALITTQLATVANYEGILASFSLPKFWKTVKANTEVLKSALNFGLDVSKDAINNHGDILKGFLNRMYGVTEKPTCNNPTKRLPLEVVDKLEIHLPVDAVVCAQKTEDPDVVELHIVNTHTYPVWVSLPSGVECMPYEEPAEIDHIEELVTQVAALSIHGADYLLEGTRSNLLKVHLSRLKKGAQIVLHINAVLLVIDMGMWLMDLVLPAINSKRPQLGKK